MEPRSPLNNGIPSDSGGHYKRSDVGSIHPDQQHYSVACRKKSKVRLNDQLIPKPTDINLGERIFPTPKEHPYSSHISRFAVFPSFCSPDDPLTGAGAASEPFLHAPIPSSALDVTVLSKTIGHPYRHEILETPMKSRRSAVLWPGEHGVLDHTKPLKTQVFYPTPPRTVLPASKRRDWELSLSERTSNMLKNLERALWVTSYQMHYTGSGPANPLKIDDFKEKMSGLVGTRSRAAPLRERSYPVFVPSKPTQGCRRQQESSLRIRASSPTEAEVLNPSSAGKNHRGPQGIIATHNEGSYLNDGNSKSEEPSHEILYKPQNEHNISRERERHKVQFDESPMQASKTEHPLEPSTSQDPQRSRETHMDRDRSLTEPSAAKYFVGQKSESTAARDQADRSLMAAVEQENAADGRETSRRIPILPRPSVLPGVRPVDGVGTACAPSLLDLQCSYSRSEAHRNFNSSVTRAAVNLRDSVVTGKKHNFFGIDGYYLRG